MSKRTSTPPAQFTAASLASHPIQAVARRTGLSADVVRAWEKRHGVVTPVRSPGGRRLYSDDDVERLRLVAQATLTGRTIGQVAALPTAALAALVEAGAPPPRRLSDAPPSRVAPPSPAAAGYLLEEALAAIGRLDVAALDLLLRRATVALSGVDFLDALAVPLIDRVGARLRDGTLRGAHGRIAHTAIRRVLDHVIADVAAPLSSPDLVVATPSAPAHELGALVVAAVAAGEGWRVTYVGPGAPADDIVETVGQLGARVVALSLGAAPADRGVSRELRRLRALLPADVEILVGGTATDVHRAVLDEIGAVVRDDLAALRDHLRTRRRSQPAGRVALGARPSRRRARQPDAPAGATAADAAGPDGGAASAGDSGAGLAAPTE